MPNILRPKLRLVVPALLAALAAGCDSATLSPDAIPGTYVLRSYNGGALPHETANLETVRYILLADTVKLGPNGTGTQTSVTRVDFRDPARPDEDGVGVSNFTYEVNDDRLRVTYICPPNALCTAGPHAIGRIEGDELVVTISDGVLRYVRED